MNERDYFIIENILLITGLLSFILGLYLLQIYDLHQSILNRLILAVFSSIILLFSVSFRFKRWNYEKEMKEELKKYMDEFKNGENKSSSDS